ncbi:interferon-induced protein 44-like isoform X2 [Fundulus heteroclitus]|uniref:interferon-induced protein 44-like isoform X2 n=1 Tax=Fundulus heteroclitus TaxID=8078 RepID=UPI00165B0C15|nr:interferon-induced protein 44-like isoform X2 [Fundulus heteroclitus]
MNDLMLHKEYKTDKNSKMYKILQNVAASSTFRFVIPTLGAVPVETIDSEVDNFDYKGQMECSIKCLAFRFGCPTTTTTAGLTSLFAAPVTSAAPSSSVFGAALAAAPPAFGLSSFNSSITSQSQNDGTKEKKKGKPIEIPGLQTKLETPWRNVQWTEEQKKNLMKAVSSYRLSCKDVPHARVLLLGPIRSGKSSFISSVQSVFSGRVTNRAMVGFSFNTSFTKKLQSFNIHSLKGEDNTGLVLCDMMGFGDGEITGLTLHDILSVIKGQVPEGHKFSADQPVGPETEGYVKTPSLGDKIHCVAFVLDASKIASYSKGFSSTFKQLREHISQLGVHQVALLTHVDKICQETANDVSQVYRSPSVRDTMNSAGALLGMSTSYIVPVKNYSSELDLDVNADVLLLSAVDHILHYVDLFFQDYMPRQTRQKFL